MLSLGLLGNWPCFDEAHVINHIRDLKTWKARLVVLTLCYAKESIKLR
jgi:hypothetical protein